MGALASLTRIFWDIYTVTITKGDDIFYVIRVTTATFPRSHISYKNLLTQFLVGEKKGTKF